MGQNPVPTHERRRGFRIFLDYHRLVFLTSIPIELKTSETAR